MEEGEIREPQIAEEQKINVATGLSPSVQDVKKAEPLSLEEILKKRKEDALQQAKVVSPLHFLKFYHLARSILVCCVYLERNYLVYLSVVFVRQHLLCT